MADYLRSQIAKMAGINSETLRYYEIRGQIQPQRTANGYRVYPEEILNEIEARIVRLTEMRGILLEIHNGLSQKHKCSSLELLLKKVE